MKHFTISEDLLRGIARRAREINYDISAAVLDAGEDHDQARAFTIADLQRAVDLFKQVDPPPVLTVNSPAEAHRLADLLGCDAPPGGAPIDARFVFAGIALKISEAVPRGKVLVFQDHRDGREPELGVITLED